MKVKINTVKQWEKFQDELVREGIIYDKRKKCFLEDCMDTDFHVVVKDIEERYNVDLQSVIDHDLIDCNKITMFEEVINISNMIKNNRTGVEVSFSLFEEVGELAKELNVKYNPNTYKKADVDGVFGEGIDVLICILDLLHVEGYTEEQILEKIKEKLAKWKEKASQTK